MSRDEDKGENCNTVLFVKFQDSFQVEHHDAIESRSCCRYVDPLSLDVDSNSFVSSAKSYVVQKEVQFGIALMNSRGLRKLLWGTPDQTGRKSDEQPSTDSRWE